MYASFLSECWRVYLIGLDQPDLEIAYLGVG